MSHRNKYNVPEEVMALCRELNRAVREGREPTHEQIYALGLYRLAQARGLWEKKQGQK